MKGASYPARLYGARPSGCSGRGPAVAGDVGRRLERAGYVTWAGRRPWRAARWVPADPDWAFAPLIRACSALDPVRPSDDRHAVLAGLAVACGLGFRLAQYQIPETILCDAIDQDRWPLI